MHDFLTNQTFLRFSLCEKGLRKARESLIYHFRAEPNRSNIFFPLAFRHFWLVFANHMAHIAM